MTAHRASLLALLLLAASACHRIPMREPDLEGPYGERLKASTRTAALYQDLETRIFAHVVWLEPQLLRAQAEQLSAERAETPDEASARLAKALADSAAPTFLAVVYTPEPSWNDWEASNSVWRIALLRGDAQFRPVKVERFERPFSAELVALYPYLDTFSVAYRLQFAPEAAGASPTLRVAGLLGKFELAWP